MTDPKNTNYAKIKVLGFDVELRNGHSGFARAYLTKAGKRTGQFTDFRDNKQPVDTKDPLTCRKGSHLDFALAELVEMIKARK